MPKLIFIKVAGNSLYDHQADFFVYNSETSTSLASRNASYRMANKVVWNGNSVSWYGFDSSGSYSGNTQSQLNEKGVTYKYIAIG